MIPLFINNSPYLIGLSYVPVTSRIIIYVESIDEGNTLILHHEHDGRDLEIEYAERVVEHLQNIWKNPVKILTIIEIEGDKSSACLSNPIISNAAGVQIDVEKNNCQKIKELE